MKNIAKKLLLITFILIILFFLGAAAKSVLWIVNESPDISNYKQWKPSQTSFIYAANGEELTKLYREKRIYLPISKIPRHLQNAVVSIEDTRFYRHHGIDPIGILRALWVDLKNMAKVQGASTITQQLAKNTLLTQEKLFTRKLKEIYIAFQFERMYTKKEILEFYLNEIFLGHTNYGVQSAANFYFNKKAENLTLSQCALLAGLIKAPNYYSPYNNKQKARKRRDLVLEQMVKQGYISKLQAERAKKQPIRLQHPQENNEELAPYFIRYVRKKLINKFGANRVYTQGLKVHTTLNPTWQKKAKKTIKKALNSGYLPTVSRKAGHGKKQPQYALVTLDAKTGAIKAMIGGRGNDKFNRVTQAHRQPGSAFKPFVYTTALNQRMSPGTVIEDIPKEYKVKNNSQDGSWIPTNYNDKYLGPTTLRVGLAKSINVMAVKLMEKVGVDKTIALAKEMGLENLVPEDENLATALGGLTKGVTPLEMTNAYSVFANEGIKTQPIVITKVYDRHDNLIWDNKSANKANKELVLDKSISYLTTDMLKSTISRGPTVWGTGWRANIGRPAAGKTGTSSNYHDAWFIGYTPNLVTGIWIGEDQPRKMEYPLPNSKDKKSKIVSSGEAAKLWGNYMEKITRNQPVKQFERPQNIITSEICTESGKLPNKYCKQKGTLREELFVKETQPTEKCSLHKKTETIKIDTSTGLKATPYCPEDKTEIKHYQVDTGFIVDNKGVPVKKYETKEINEDEEIKLPVTDKQGNYIYKKTPQKKCAEHTPENTSEKIKEKVLNFFNSLAD